MPASLPHSVCLTHVPEMRYSGVPQQGCNSENARPLQVLCVTQMFQEANEDNEQRMQHLSLGGGWRESLESPGDPLTAEPRCW